MINSNYLEQVWAKSDGTTLLEHTQHVVNAATNLLDRLPLDDHERILWSAKLFRCAVLHDLGKIHPAFQERLRGHRTVSIRHEIISLWFCQNFLELPSDEIFAIATHHKGVIRSDATGRLERPDLEGNLKEHFNSGKALLSRATLECWLKLLKLDLKTKLVAPVQEISSRNLKLLHSSYQESVVPDNMDRQKLSYMRALLIASDHIGSARMENKIPCYKGITLRDFQPRNQEGGLLNFRDYQLKLQDIQTSVILHAPTGSGKTEGALSWVYANQKHNTRLFYLLPYTASINAMVSRLQQVFGEHRVTALHSKTLDFFYDQLSKEEPILEESDTSIYEQRERIARSWKSLSSEIFFPVKVATLHQILKSCLKGKGWELALYDFKNALFIVDEFHTYNPLLMGMLLASVKLLRRVFTAKFFFMSATIPDFMLRNLASELLDSDLSKIVRLSPSRPSDAEVLYRKRHRLICKDNGYLFDVITEIHGHLSKNRTVLIVVNNVKTAQALFEKMGEGDSVELLHSGFHRRDRIRIEKRITHRDRRKRPRLLISTQAVEVSLDIDYDVAYIENAPIDALIQRFGRVNRAGKIDPAPIFIFKNIIGKTPFYDKDAMNLTWKFLQPFHESELSENDLLEVCNMVYANGYNEVQQKDFELGLNNRTINNFENEWIAGNWDNWVEELLNNNTQKVEILCHNLIEEFDRLKDQKRFIEANQLLLDVYYYELTGTRFSKDDKRNVIVAHDFEYGKKGYQKMLLSVEDRML